jgi:teichuronic acid biosynthesis glycosyltransferase TuaG
MISILMPIYNGIEFIDESVSTILYQTYKDWELIIGINGHLKNSEVYQIAKKYEMRDKRIKVYDLSFDTIKGKAAALNEMLNLCSSESKWISLLDVDDKWLPKKLESQIPFTKEYDVIGTMCKYFGDLNISPNIPQGDISKYDFLSVNPIINSSCLVKKELCYWDGTFNGVEDYDLWLRLWKQGKKFYNVNSIQILHRIHKESAFNAKGNNLRVNDLRNKYR